MEREKATGKLRLVDHQADRCASDLFPDLAADSHRLGDPRIGSDQKARRYINVEHRSENERLFISSASSVGRTLGKKVRVTGLI